MPDKFLEKWKEKKQDKTTVFCLKKRLFFMFPDLEIRKKNITNSFFVEIVTFPFSMVS